VLQKEILSQNAKKKFWVVWKRFKKKRGKTDKEKGFTSSYPIHFEKE
jgi:hypothetical protein